MKDENGNRMVAYDALITDEYGVIWCMITENIAGYQSMAGDPDKLQAPWYLACFEHHKREDGSIDYGAAHKRAKEIANQWNAENGFTEKDVMEIVASSMRAQMFQETLPNELMKDE